MKQYIKVSVPLSYKFRHFVTDKIALFSLSFFAMSLFFAPYVEFKYEAQEILLDLFHTSKTTGLITESSIKRNDVKRSAVAVYVIDYSVGSEKYKQTIYAEFFNKTAGETIEVEYLNLLPEIMQVARCKTSYYHEFADLFFSLNKLFLAGCLVSLIMTHFYFRRFSKGVVTTAHLLKKPGRKVYKKQIYFQLEFEFVVRETGKRILIEQSITDARPILDEKDELIVYLENNPEKHYFVDKMSPKLRKYIRSEWKRQTAIKNTKYTCRITR